MGINIFISIRRSQQKQRVLIMKGFLRCIECGASVKRTFKSDSPLCPACKRNIDLYLDEVALIPHSRAWFQTCLQWPVWSVEKSFNPKPTMQNTAPPSVDMRLNGEDGPHLTDLVKSITEPVWSALSLLIRYTPYRNIAHLNATIQPAPLGNGLSGESGRTLLRGRFVRSRSFGVSAASVVPIIFQ